MTLKELLKDESGFFEDKRVICAGLARILKLCREYWDLTDLIYYGPDDIPDLPGEEFVLAVFQAPRPDCRICVTADSGDAMIRDIMRGLLKA